MDTKQLLRPSNESCMVEKTILNSLLDKVVVLTQLPNNWDGYGAVPPNELTNRQLNIFINLLPERLLQYITNEDVYPTPHGTIVLDFRKSDNELTIECGEQEYGFFTDFKHNKNIKLKRTMYNQTQISNELAEAINLFYRA